jgi:hypothetical protein
MDKLNIQIKNYLDKPIKRFDEDSRWYSAKSRNLWKPSVTTIIGQTLNKGPGYDEWLGNHPSYKEACAVRDEAASIGSLVHDSIETILGGFPVDLEKCEYKNKVWKRMMSFQKWHELNSPYTVIAKEIKLWHKDIAFSGTPDLVIEKDNELYLIDYKTGAHYKSHELQCSMYKILWDKIFPEYPVNYIMGMYLKDTWISKVEPLVKNFKFCPEEVDACVKLWTWYKSTAKGKPYPSQKMHVDKVFSLRDEENL